MVVKIFVLGRPGSGKSTAASHMMKYATSQDLNAMHIRDYNILHAMFTSGDAYESFSDAGHGGFNVTRFEILDEVLVKLQRQVEQADASTRLIIIEFARDNYYEALGNFTEEFLRDAYFLFLDANIDLCVQRVYNRVASTKEQDRHFVSEEIIRGYYKSNTCGCLETYPQSERYMQSKLQQLYGIDPYHIALIENEGSKEQFLEQVEQFIEFALFAPVPAR